MFNFQNAFRFNQSFFKRVGKVVLRRHKANIFNKGLNAAGQKFAPYTEAYKKRKMAGKVAPNQVSRSGTPDLTLTGQMKKSFGHLKATKEGFEYGITNPQMAERMEFQGPRKKKRAKLRFVSTVKDPTTPDLQEYIAKSMQAQLVKNLTKEIQKSGMGVKVYTI
tara:strand:- start:440 stop:931 length:492 start_codon:yes stop_codon:yes gene_type:complete